MAGKKVDRNFCLTGLKSKINRKRIIDMVTFSEFFFGKRNFAKEIKKGVLSDKEYFFNRCDMCMFISQTLVKLQ